jgi:DNA repair protein RecO (recombination protein O)
MQVFHIRAVVLRQTKYGDTSLIVSAYTDLFGIQSYLIKGVRQSSKKSAGRAMYFQPGSILDMEVYHSEFKQLQFVKEYQWAYVYRQLFTDVVKHAVAMYMIELLQHSLKQPEANPEMFALIAESLQELDMADDAVAANLPVYFTLKLCAELGFQIAGDLSGDIFDLKEGCFISSLPDHPYYIDGTAAATTAAIIKAGAIAELGSIASNRVQRREMLQAYQTFMALHIPDFGELRSWPVLQEVLG